MKKTPLIIISIFIFLFVLGSVFFFSIREEPIREFHLQEKETSGHPQAAAPRAIDRLTKEKINEIKEFKENKKRQEQERKALEKKASSDTDRENEREVLTGIEEIKQRIYDINIENTTQIGLLDDLVQTRDIDTRKLWGNNWSSADDWKKNKNGFRLDKTDDGALVFFPDEQTAKTYSFFETPQEYTYDEENREFVNEIDFYGKTIYNVAKFINEDVLVMMTISGEKVDLNIYQKHTPSK